MTDESWRRDGLTLPPPEADLMKDVGQQRAAGDAAVLLERLQREREYDAA